jgi:hypothetical protein
MRGYWDRDVVANYPGTIFHRPADEDYDLRFHIPNTALAVSGPP